MSLLRDELHWVAPPVAAGVVVYFVYLATNPYPAHGAGLYLTMAAEVSEQGYVLPRAIPYYTRDGIPFAYPPLAIYVVALVRDATGIGPLTLSRWLPGLVVIASIVPTYLFAREVLESRPGASLASTLVAANPQLLDWHLTAGGLVRAPAFLFTATGLYAGIRLFRSETRDRRWLGLSIACFLATLLVHPTYALFLAVFYLVPVAVADRSLAGLVRGSIVGVAGVLLAAPWWLTVVRTHGVDVFLGATGTHGGVGGGVVARAATAPLGPVELLLVAVLALGVLGGLATGRSLLVAWLLATCLVFGQPRFTLFVGTVLLVAVVLEVGAELRPRDRPWLQSGGLALLLAFALVLGVLTGVSYVRDDTAAPMHTITPDNVEGADLDAMAWSRSTTPRGASFLVLGDASEWFPYFSKRTLLVSPWGTEWEGSRSYARHLALYQTVSACETEHCLTAALRRGEARPDYVYVPKETYHVQGTPHRETGGLSRSLERSERYVLVFENEGVAIFRVDPRHSTDSRGEDRSPPTPPPGGSVVPTAYSRYSFHI